MGVERFEDSDDRPSQEAEADLPRDTGGPGDADRSRETPQSDEASRPEEPAPDNSPTREPSERADAEAKPAESRTRTEYADHVTPPGSPPIEGDSPKRETEDPNSIEDEHGTMPYGQGHTEESHSAREPDQDRAEEHWDKEKPHTGEDATAPKEQQRGPDDPALEPIQPRSETSSPINEPKEAREETDSVPNVSWKTDDDPGRAPDDTRGAPAVDKLDDPPPEAAPIQETDRGQSLDAESMPSPEPNEESPSEEPLVTEDTSETDRPTHRLTDKEWAEHLAEVRRTLDQTREEGLESHLVYTIDPDHQSWTKERRELHNSIINDLYSATKDIPNTGQALVAGGLGGAGKTTVLTEQAGIDTSQYLIINPDNLKVEMARRGMTPEIEGLSPMEASDLVHEESSHLARQLALRAYSDRKNVIWDITMSDEKRTAARLDEMRNTGYARIDGLFVDIPVETSIKRTESRHREGHEKFLAGSGLGGRPVPPKVIRDQVDAEWGSKNRRTFNNLKSRLDNWSIYDNSVDERPALIVESSRRNYVD